MGPGLPGAGSRRSLVKPEGEAGDKGGYLERNSSWGEMGVRIQQRLQSGCGAGDRHWGTGTVSPAHPGGGREERGPKPLILWCQLNVSTSPS